MGLRDIIRTVREYPAVQANLEAARLELRQAQQALERSTQECEQIEAGRSNISMRLRFSERKVDAYQAVLEALCPKQATLEEMKRLYDTISPSLDTGGFTLYHTVKKLTGIPDADLLAEVERQAAEYAPPADTPGYAPSEDTVRLTNAINRGLEKPEHPEEVTALIMQGISARYACFPTQMTAADILRLIREKDYDQAIQYITITAENAVTVTFR